MLYESGEMALGLNLLQGQGGEWALVKRHPSEDFFGVQVCGCYVDVMARMFPENYVFF